jgi:hypothetical protein
LSGLVLACPGLYCLCLRRLACPVSVLSKEKFTNNITIQILFNKITRYLQARSLSLPLTKGTRVALQGGCERNFIRLCYKREAEKRFLNKESIGLEVSRTPKGHPEQLAIVLTYQCKLVLSYCFRFTLNFCVFRKNYLN